MTVESPEVRTTIATLVRVQPDLLEVRYNKGCLLTPEHLTEVQETRRRIMGDQQYAMLTIIPKDVDFSLNAMEKDYLAEDRSMGLVLATAIVAKANMIEQLLEIYFKYYPQPHRVLVTDKEAKARRWLKSQLAEIEREVD